MASGESPAAAAKRLTLIEGVLPALIEPTTHGKAELVEAAEQLADAPLDQAVKIALLGGPHADPRRQAKARERLEARAAELRETLGQQPVTTPDRLTEAEARVAAAAAKTPSERKASSSNGQAPANGSGPPPLAHGTSGEHVRMAQSRLAELGYETPTDGTYGQGTADAVKSFQRHHDLKIDGVVGPKTTVAMRGTNSAHVAEVSKAKAQKARRQAAARARAKARREDAGKPKPEEKPEEGSPEEEAAEPEDEKKAEGDSDVEVKVSLKKGAGERKPSDEVKDVQEALTRAGSYIGEAGADGWFGAETRAGVRRFQRRSKLKSDGVVGPETHKALEEFGVPMPSKKAMGIGKPTAKGRGGSSAGKSVSTTGALGEFNPALHPRAAKGTPGGGQFITANSTGKLAKAVRKKLGIKGSGDFAQKVKQFQKQNGLQVDGVVGAQTAAALAGSTTASTVKAGGLDTTARNSLASLTHAAKSGKTPQLGKSSSSSSGSSSGSSGSGSSSGKSSSGSSSGSSSSGSSSSSSGLIRRGATGSVVSTLANALNVKGNPTTYNKQLKQAIEQFQRSHGLQVDGIVGAQTAAALLGRSARAPGKMGNNLEQALQNAKPKQLQHAAPQLDWIDVAATDLIETAMKIVEEAGEEALRPFIELGPRQLYEAVDSMAKATTPEPFSTSKTSNWVARVGGLPPYVQHVAHDLIERGKGITESRAIGMAVGIIKNWAHGHNGKGGTVHPDTVAAAQLALREWQEKKAKAHAMAEAMTKAEKDDVGDKTTEQTLKCPECGNEQSAKLTQCKKCGHDMSKVRKAKFGSMKEASLLSHLHFHYMGEASGNLFRRLPGGKWQLRGRTGEWIDMNEPPHEQLTVAKGFGSAPSDRNVQDIRTTTTTHTMREAKSYCRGKHLLNPDDVAEAKAAGGSAMVKCKRCGKTVKVSA